jgi:hypothetical protein
MVVTYGRRTPPTTMKVAFLTNHISYGGTDVSLYDYAHFNETLLGNTSIILTRDFRASHGEIYAKFQNRFPVFFIASQADINAVAAREGVDVVYVQKSGEVDWFVCTNRPCVVHAVFDTRFPHGDVYAAISSSLNTLYRTQVPVVPYMVYVEDSAESFREELGIPADALVVGRHGSYGSFDIDFVHTTVVELLEANPTMVFVALNTKPFAEHPRIRYLPCTTDLRVKRKFINTCDVMLHARARGETFGLACGEFAVCKVPIISYALSPERAHLEILGSACTTYSSADDLRTIFATGSWKKDMSTNGYLRYTPQHVMALFHSVFLTRRRLPLAFLR